MACDICVTSAAQPRRLASGAGRLTCGFVEPTRGLEPLTARLQAASDPSSRVQSCRP